MSGATPFYAESGGQVGDTGKLAGEDFTFIVEDTQKAGDAIVHFGEVTSGELNPGDVVNAIVDGERRADIVLNHSATHLLHAALRTVLGDHVQQKGSLVAPDRLRFDFSHYEAVTAEQLAAIEALVNEHFDLRPKAIVQGLDLLRPIYKNTAAYGHFGRTEAEFSWEQTDKADALRAAAGL